MNEVVGNAVDVGVDHQGIDKAHDEHDPKRRVRVEEEHRQEKREMKKASERRHQVPAGIGEDL